MPQSSRRTFVKRLGAAAGSGLLLGSAATGEDAAGPRAGQIRFERSLPVGRAYDVVVCGGGPSGCAAALAARREGLTILLVEGQGQLGGMATSGLVSHWLGGRNQKGEWVVGGLFRSLAEEAVVDESALPRISPRVDQT